MAELVQYSYSEGTFPRDDNSFFIMSNLLYWGDRIRKTEPKVAQGLCLVGFALQKYCAVTSSDTN